MFLKEDYRWLIIHKTLTLFFLILFLLLKRENLFVVSLYKVFNEIFIEALIIIVLKNILFFFCLLILLFMLYKIFLLKLTM